MSDIRFTVYGRPIPKQSFRMGKYGGYTDPRVTAWQDEVALVAKQAMGDRLPIVSAVKVRIDFRLPDAKRMDLDNLSKAILDACNGVVWRDDEQVRDLHLVKWLSQPEPGVIVEVKPLYEGI